MFAFDMIDSMLAFR